MGTDIKLLKFFTSASELIQAAFFFGLILVASTVAYFQSYEPSDKTNITAKQHAFAYMKTFMSGFLAFVFTLLMAATMNWGLFWTCLVGGVAVLFSKQFFDALYKFVIERVFGQSSTGSTNKPLEIIQNAKEDGQDK